MTDVTVAGCGFMGCNHAQAVSEHPTLELASVVDTDRSAAESVATEFGTSDVYVELEEAVADADAAIVASPEQYHVDQAQTVLNHDRHLLLEKPVSVDTEAAWNLAERANSTERTTGVSFVLRYDPGYAQLRSAFQNDEIGAPVSVTATRGITINESRRIGERGHPLYYLNIHDIDAMQWVLDSRIDRVTGVERRGNLSDVDVPDATHATVQFENGAIGTLTGYGVLPDSTPGGITAQFHLVGSEGTATVDTPGTVLTVNSAGRYDRPDTRHWPVVNERMDGAVRRQIDRFGSAIHGDDDLLASIADGARAQSVADAIRRSIETGTAHRVT